MTDNLPERWFKTNLGLVARFVSGKTPKLAGKVWETNGLIPWVKVSDMNLPGNEKEIRKTTSGFTPEQCKEHTLPILPKGAVVIPKRGGAIATDKKRIVGVECTIDTNVMGIVADGIDERYLFHWFNGLNLADIGGGTIVPQINKQDLEPLAIPIAPLNEQKRIADKLDVLLARVEACRERLERVPQILKRFRQSVLAAAVSGKLTEDWREEYQLEQQWNYVRLEDVTSKVGSGATPKGGEQSYKSNGIPLIRSMNVIFHGFKFEGLAHIDDKQAYDLRNAEVKEGDVLLNITGASIGRVTKVPPSLDGARVNQHVCIIRVSRELTAEFLNIYLSSPEMQDLIGSENYGVTRQALTKQQILDFTVPCPSHNEQLEIIRRTDLLFSLVDAITSRFNEAEHLVSKLSSSILAKAFRGELVPQDPNDEPASELLARLQHDVGKPKDLATVAVGQKRKAPAEKRKSE